MKVNIINCYKPKSSENFQGQGQSAENHSRKIRYKHFEQMDNDTLELYSINKAKAKAENSAKMRAFKAIPTAAALTIGTILATTQPGKLSTKVATGLGFLAVTKTSEKILDKAVKYTSKKASQKEDRQNSKNIKSAVAFGVGALATTASVIAIGANIPKLAQKVAPALTNVAKKDVKALANEINSTKLAKVVEKTVEPLIQKNPIKTSILTGAGIAGTLFASDVAQAKIGHGIIKDFKKDAITTYATGKIAQQKAREHFDSIDAQEI